MMAVIIIKWGVMTTDNPHMQLGPLDLLGGCCFVNARLKPKTHTDVCGTKPQTPVEIPAIVLVHACASFFFFLNCLLMEIFQQMCNF